MNKTQFEKDLEIDLENLDAECVLQPELYFKYCSLSKDAREAFDMAKFNLQVTEAELGKKIRSKPGMFGLSSRPTESAIKSTISTHPRYKTAHREMIQLRKESELLSSTESAMEMRKRMLESLITLYSREYFSGPKVAHTPATFKKQIKRQKEEKLEKKLKSIVRKRKSRD